MLKTLQKQGLYVVEMGGVEPPSEWTLKKRLRCLACFKISLAKLKNRQKYLASQPESYLLLGGQ